MKTRSMISFDWAMKRLLRNKANKEKETYPMQQVYQRIYL